MAISPVSPTSQSPKWHMTLTDGTTTVGFVLVNGRGKRDEKAKRRYPLRPDAIRIQQGESKYSDNDVKYSALAQDDWSGGRGADRFDADKTRFSEGYGVNSMERGAITLGPAIHYAVGYRGAQNFMSDASYPRIRLLNADDGRYLATKFTATAFTGTINSVRFYRRYFGSPGNLTVRLRADSGGSPGAVQRTATISGSGGGTLGSDLSFAKVDFPTSFVPNNGTSYWIEVFAAATDDEDNYWEVIGNSSTVAGNAKDSDNGSSYTNATYGMQFRVVDPNDPFIARFFEYKGQMYFFLDYDRETSSELYMNGWRGAADSNSGALSKLKDSTQDWSVSWFDGLIARVLTGKASAYEKPDWRRVSAGANGQITVTPNWKYNHETTDDYVVLGSDYFQAITLPSSGWTNDPVTDVVVDNDKVWICKGELASMWAHREHNNAGTWTAGATSANWVKANGFVGSKAAIHRDPVLGNLLYTAHEPAEKHSYTPEIMRSFLPKGWNTNGAVLNQVQLWDGKTENWATGDPTYVTVTNYDNLRVTEIVVRQGVPTGVTVAAAGEDYQVGDILTIEEWGVGTAPPGNYTSSVSGRNATVRVASINGTGGILTVDTLTGGFDYSDKVSAVSGGSGTGASMNVTTSGFTTGVMATLDMNAEVDGRQMNLLTTVLEADITIAAGDVSLLVDDDAAAASPFITAPAPLLLAGSARGAPMIYEFDPEDYDDLSGINSLGLQLNSQIQSFTLKIKYWVRMRSKFDPIDLGEAGEQVNNLVVYGDPKQVWVLTDRNVYELRGGNPVPIQLDELRSARSWLNGVAAAVNDVYLYFNIGPYGYHRYFRQNLENVSPRTEYSFQNWAVQGAISSALTYPGRVYIGTDGSYSKTNRKSRVMAFEGRGWHEVYTSEGTGEKIRAMMLQPMEGYMDRLWINNGDDVFWMPVSMDSVLNPDSDSDYRVRPEGYFETGWIYTGKEALLKVFKSLDVVTENVSSNGAWIDVFYKTDSNTSWNEVGTINTGTSQTIRLVSGGFATGKRIKFKFRFSTRSGFAPPVLRTWVLNYYAIDAPKYGYTWTTILTEGDLSINLEGDEDKTWGAYDNAEDALDQLDAWAQATTPLIQNSVFSVYNGKDVSLKFVPAQADKVLPDEQIEEHIVQITTEEL